MDVVVIGGHGKVALRLQRLLAQRGDRVRGVIRNPDQAADLEAIGAEPVVGDVEQLDDIAELIVGADAVVFAAGAGPGSGPERKRTVDYGGALKLIRACHSGGVRRYLMISAQGVGHPALWGEAMRPYYQAKLDADKALRMSGLDWTIARPGRLTDDPGAGLIEVAPEIEPLRAIPRDDVAATLVACLDAPNTVGVSFDLVAGETPIEEAVSALRRPSLR
jgi:uncharacterized protein YbjT (DUF2867 family)